MKDQPTPPTPSQSWRAVEVREGKTEPNPKGAGSLQKFYVDFEGAVDGFQAGDTYWRRRAGNAPQTGATFNGTIKLGEYGYMFQLDSGRTGTSGGANVRPAKSDWKPESQFDPERTARITRSHAQQMALRYLSMRNGSDKLPTLREVFDAATQFEVDVLKAGQAAVQGAGSPSGVSTGATPSSAEATTGPAPEQPPPDRHQYLCRLIEDAGLPVSYAATKLADFIINKFSEDQIERAIKGMENFDAQAHTLKRLTVAYEGHAGEPLPASPPIEEDIPF